MKAMRCPGSEGRHQFASICIAKEEGARSCWFESCQQAKGSSLEYSAHPVSIYTVSTALSFNQSVFPCLPEYCSFNPSPAAYVLAIPAPLHIIRKLSFGAVTSAHLHRAAATAPKQYLRTKIQEVTAFKQTNLTGASSMRESHPRRQQSCI
jgi:hypothetical protein